MEPPGGSLSARRADNDSAARVSQSVHINVSVHWVGCKRQRPAVSTRAPSTNCQIEHVCVQILRPRSGVARGILGGAGRKFFFMHTRVPGTVQLYGTFGLFFTIFRHNFQGLDLGTDTSNSSHQNQRAK